MSLTPANAAPPPSGGAFASPGPAHGATILGVEALCAASLAGLALADRPPLAAIFAVAAVFGAARAFIARARRVIAAGRPSCPLCSMPLDATGHVCPRQNGYRR